MLFNSYVFLFGFLPVVTLGFFLLGRYSPKAAAGWLALASVAFYGWWDWAYVPLLLGSAAFNYVVGRSIAGATGSRAAVLLGLGVTADLAVLGWFKYVGFFVSAAVGLSGVDWVVPHVVLPLGVSFFTFTQIAFLVDARRGVAREMDPVHYLLFVTYYPHLIAGPVIHHADIMPQFGQARVYRPEWANISQGLTLLSIGLFKKCVLADGVAPYADTLFNAGPATHGLMASWSGAIAYTFQLYFDFSGYSDMAVGLSRLYGVALPINFHSPYKAGNIIEFWRRWHMTLSRFLRDYLYIPLGGNRHGTARRHLNLMLTMVLGGLWHGAGWTFVAWGALHGSYLMANHGWHWLAPRLGAKSPLRPAGCWLGGALTFAAVVTAWVFFRSPDMGTALSVLVGMTGMNGLGAAPGRLELVVLVLEAAVVWLLPNSNELMTAAGGRLRWRPNTVWAGVAASALVLAVMQMYRPASFLYFNF